MVFELYFLHGIRALSEIGVRGLKRICNIQVALRKLPPFENRKGWGSVGGSMQGVGTAGYGRPHIS